MENSELENSEEQLPAQEENVHAEDLESNIINEESLLKEPIKENKDSTSLDSISSDEDEDFCNNSIREEKAHENLNEQNTSEEELEPPGCEDVAILIENSPDDPKVLESKESSDPDVPINDDMFDWDLIEQEIRMTNCDLLGSAQCGSTRQRSRSSSRSSRSSNDSEPEPPGEEEIELITEIPVIKIRSRSSSRSSSSSSSSRSRSRSRSKEREQNSSKGSRRDDRRRSSWSRTKSKSRSRSNGDFVVLDSTGDNDGKSGAPGEDIEDDIIEVEVIRSNLARAESRQRSRSKSNQRRSRSKRSRSKSGVVSDLRDKISSRRIRRIGSRSPDGYENWRRSEARRREEVRERKTRERRRERRQDDEWKRKSEAFIAKLGGAPEPRGFSVPPPTYVSYSQAAAEVYTSAPYSAYADHQGYADHNSNPVTQDHHQSQSPEVVLLDEDDTPEQSYEAGQFGRMPQQTDSEMYQAGGSSWPSTGQDIDLRNLGSLPLGNGENLRPGNYLLVNYDLMSVGSGLSSCIYQLGSWSWHGDSFLQCVVPGEEGSMLELARQHMLCPLIELSGCHYVRHPVKGQFVRCVLEEEAVRQFLVFLETGKNRVRPVYDGIVLISHTPDIIPQLVKSVRRSGLFDKFAKLVSGMGDLASFLSQKKPRQYNNLNSLETDYEKTFGRKMSPQSPMCEDRAKISQEILGKLLETAPTFSNFFSSYSNPLTSTKTLKLINFKTTEERQELFRPLEVDIADQLQQQEGDLTVEGLYAPQAGPGQATGAQPSPKLVASAVIRILISAGFHFDQLLDMVKIRGIGDLELQLRTAFLGMMAGQSRQVVDQTILATRLVVRYFQINGGRTIDDLMAESKQLQINNERIETAEESRQEGVEEFLHLKNHLLRRFGHSTFMKFACELSIQCLVDSGVREASLVNRCAEPHDRRGMMEWLGDRLGGVRAKCGGGVAVSSLARSIVEYGAAQAQTRSAAETSSDSWEGGQLRQNINMVEQLLSSNKDRMAAYHSLVAIKQYFLSNMMEETIHSGGDRGQVKMVAECCHKVLSLLGISHYSLKGEFDRGETSFRAGLRGKLGEVEHLLPAGVGGNTVVELCTRYFRSHF